MSLLVADQLTKYFGGLAAVNGVSFELPEGGITALIGPNGAGKSTLFNLITNVYQLSSGTVKFEGRNISGMPTHKIAQQGIIRTFQTARVFKDMTVLENVMSGSFRVTKAGTLAIWARLPRVKEEEVKVRERSLNLLEAVGLRASAHVAAGSLSLAKQRLVEIARALASQPILLLLDEPAAGLDVADTSMLAEVIKDISDSKVTVFVVEHHMELVMSIAQRVIVLDSGMMIADGTPDEVQSDSRVVEVYLGSKEET